MRTIVVTGTGSVSAAPDYITLYLTVEGTNADYDLAVELSAQKITALQAAIARADFKKKDLKTTGFNVDTRYENERTPEDLYRQVFAGYVCTYQLKLSFDYDAARLSRVLRAISESASLPEISVSFTVKEPAAIKKELLVSAAENAREKAEILCQASGVRLGKLQSIDYHRTDSSISSPTRCMSARDSMTAMGKCMQSIEMEPEDIALNDTASFVWEIEDMQ